MTVVNRVGGHGTLSRETIPPQGQPPNVEALPGLGWSQAVELPRAANLATAPSESRRAWVHLAPERQVLTLYRASCAGTRAPAAPWWLRALAAGTLASRDTAFRIEDDVAALLGQRSGWVYVPWGSDGDPGYWEFSPSEQFAANPTSLQHTDRHTGFIDVIPAHDDEQPEALAVAGIAELRSRIGEFEAIR